MSHLTQNVDATFADSGTDASVKQHQQDHDIIQQHLEQVYTGNISGAATINLANGSTQILTLIGNVTSVAVTGADSGFARGAMLYLKQDATGNRTFATSWRWSGGTDAVLSTAANAIDRVVIETTDGGTIVYADLVGKAYA